MSLPVIAYVLQPDQVIFTPTTENGPLPGIYAASDFIAKWRDWDAGTAGRPARAWHTLFDAVLKAGDRFDFFLLDEALKAYGEELFPDPQERLEWCIRTAIGLERWDEAKRLINVLDGYARVRQIGCRRISAVPFAVCVPSGLMPEQRREWRTTFWCRRSLMSFSPWGRLKRPST